MEICDGPYRVLNFNDFKEKMSFNRFEKCHKGELFQLNLSLVKVLAGDIILGKKYIIEDYDKDTCELLKTNVVIYREPKFVRVADETKDKFRIDNCKKKEFEGKGYHYAAELITITEVDGQTFTTSEILLCV